MIKKYSGLLWLLLLFTACQPEKMPRNTLFTQMDPKETGVNFENHLAYKEEFNIYRYRNRYWKNERGDE